jgi:hypothetical protein
MDKQLLSPRKRGGRTGASPPLRSPIWRLTDSNGSCRRIWRRPPDVSNEPKCIW